MRFQRRRQHPPVQLSRLFRPEGFRGAALDEQPLGGVKRRQGFVTCGELTQRRTDAEQLADEIVQMGRQIDQQPALAASGGQRAPVAPARPAAARPGRRQLPSAIRQSGGQASPTPHSRRGR